MSEKESAELRKYSLLALVASILLFIASLIEDDAELRQILRAESLLGLLVFWVLYNLAIMGRWRDGGHSGNDKQRGLCRVTSQERYDTSGPT
ncbi:hypothetical protein [Thermofilum sp.]|jgi:hypothetical protein|uniref:hypothetical protein n=1 Tax=Thermofilum sp. TaxID=1961369 RepID=UPI0025871D3B|nr:hypothetical protein [Thermofilum sp.]